MSSKALGCWGVSCGSSSQERGVPWIWDPQGQRLELEGEASPLTISHCLEMLSFHWTRGVVRWVVRWVPAARHCPACTQWQPAGYSIHRVPSGARGSIPGDKRNPKTPQQHPASPSLSLLPALAFCSSFLHIPESQKLSSSHRGLFPMLPNFPGWEKSLETSFWIPPPASPLL